MMNVHVGGVTGPTLHTFERRSPWPPSIQTLSPHPLFSPTLPSSLVHALAHAHAPPHSLISQLTHSSYIHRCRRATECPRRQWVDAHKYDGFFGTRWSMSCFNSLFIIHKHHTHTSHSHITHTCTHHMHTSHAHTHHTHTSQVCSMPSSFSRLAPVGPLSLKCCEKFLWDYLESPHATVFRVRCGPGRFTSGVLTDQGSRVRWRSRGREIRRRGKCPKYLSRAAFIEMM